MSQTPAEERPVPRGLATLALALVATSLVAHGLSSGTGQALLNPGSILVLDSFALVAAISALASRELSGQPGLAAEPSVLVALAAFLGLAFLQAFRGTQSHAGIGTAGSWAALALLGLTARDLARRGRAIAHQILGVVVGVATAASLLALHRLWFESRQVLEEVKRLGDAVPEAMRREMLYRASDPMAIGPFLLPSHLATCAGIALPLVLAIAYAAHRRGARPWVLASGGIALVLGLGIAFARSKGATLATGLGIAAFAFLAIPRERAVLRRRVVLGAGALLALVLLGGVVRYVQRPTAFGVGMSVQVRLEYWRAAARSFAEKPLAGHGLESFVDELPRHKEARAEEARHAHDDLLELASEMGALGPLAFVALIVALARARAEKPEPARRLALPPFVAVANGMGLGALALLAHGDTYSIVQWEQVFAGAFVAIGVARLVVAALANVQDDDARLLAAAARAGALVFVLDGLTDFPLRVHGLVAMASVLACVAPSLEAGTEERKALPRPARVAVGIVVTALVLAGLAQVRPVTAEDGVRTSAVEDAARAMELARPSGRRPTLEEMETARVLLTDATQKLRELLEADALAPRDVLFLVEAEELAGRIEHDSKRHELILRELDDATRKRPGSTHLWAEYGRHLARTHALEKATLALDRASRLYPVNPRRRLEAGAVRAELVFARGWRAEDANLRELAIHELTAALACARASRLERLRLTDEEIHLAHALLISLGAAPRGPGEEEPAPPP